ncbi:MAG: hypothetical protein OXI15_17350, partial [Chromatiales bacterium]|nr:hypothetical protein [Chromatiales bacterium]
MSELWMCEDAPGRACSARRIAVRKMVERCREEAVGMTSLFGGRGTEDGRIASALAPGDMDGDRRAMTLLGLPGAWLRRLRSPVFRPGSSRIGGDRWGRPGSLGRTSAAGRGIAGALDGVRRLGRAAVPALVCLALLAGVATKVYAQTLPTVSFPVPLGPTWRLDEDVSADSSVIVGLKLDKTSTSDFTVNYTVGGTATPGSDFTVRYPKIWVPKGATGRGLNSGFIWMHIVDDSVHEDNETVVFTLTEGEGYEVGSPSTITVTIVDDESTVSFASASQSAGEGSGTHNVGVTLSPAPTTDVTFTYTVGGTAAAGSDFTIANSGTVTVLAGATTATIPVTVIDDTVPESNETVVLKLIGSAGYSVAGPGTHTLTIVDDEPTVSFASASQSAGEGSGT